ncbi:MAG: rod shape-determining protein RodA [Vicingaceae bacterium]|nr:rod shape-determining protein RodA [Vicingaceae bacterium]
MPNIRIKEFKTKVIATVIIAIPALLILLQNDTGSTLTYAAFIFLLYREGLSGNILLFGVLAILVFVLTLVFGATTMIIFGFVVYALLYAAIKYDLKATVFSLLGIIVFFIFYSYFEIKYIFIFYGIAAIITFITLFIITHKKLKDKGSHYLGIFIFVVSCAYIYSIDFAFNKVLKEHQRTRITVLLGEEDQLIKQIKALEFKMNEETFSQEQKLIIKTDLKTKKESLKELQQGNGWNIKQSLIAIGSGGFSGKGFLKGTQTKFNFVPEQSTDFIFCTIGEEWGFLGTSFVIMLYMALFLRIIFLAEKQRSTFSRIYGYGVASILFIHFIVNIGMTIGLVPVIGIPLPFISYGGSSLWSFTILLFIFIKLDSERLFVLR